MLGLFNALDVLEENIEALGYGNLYELICSENISGWRDGLLLTKNSSETYGKDNKVHCLANHLIIGELRIFYNFKRGYSIRVIRNVGVENNLDTSK